MNRPETWFSGVHFPQFSSEPRLTIPATEIPERRWASPSAALAPRLAGLLPEPNLSGWLVVRPGRRVGRRWAGWHRSAPRRAGLRRGLPSGSKRGCRHFHELQQCQGGLGRAVSRLERLVHSRSSMLENGSPREGRRLSCDSIRPESERWLAPRASGGGRGSRRRSRCRGLELAHPPGRAKAPAAPRGKHGRRGRATRRSGGLRFRSGHGRRSD